MKYAHATTVPRSASQAATRDRWIDGGNSRTRYGRR